MRVPLESGTSLVVRCDRLLRRFQALNLLDVRPVGRNLGHAVAFIRIAVPAGQSNLGSHSSPSFVLANRENRSREPMHAIGFATAMNTATRNRQTLMTTHVEGGEGTASGNEDSRPIAHWESVRNRLPLTLGYEVWKERGPMACRTWASRKTCCGRLDLKVGAKRWAGGDS